MSDSDRVSTGIPGLDAVLGGGVFEGGTYVIQGAPGAGKTILGNQICFGQAAHGRRALYVTLLAESHSRLIGHMRRMEFFDETAIPDRMSYLGAFRTLESNGLRGLLDIIRREVRDRNVNLLVLDGLMTLTQGGSSDLELKKFIHELQTQASFSNCTMFLLTSALNVDAYTPEHTMVDGLIELRSSLHGRRAEREIVVHKLRGSWFMGGRHSYRISAAGCRVFPRIEALLETPSVWDSADGPMVSTGIAGVDEMLGGGVETHSVTVVLGPSGSGKTTAGLQFLTGGAPGEPAMLFGFHENPRALQLKAQALRLGLDVHSETMNVLWRPQTEAILDEVTTDLLSAIRQRGIRRLVIDGIEGFSKLTDEKERVASFLSALCNELRAMGITTLATVETEHVGMTPGQPMTGLHQAGLSAVAENIIALHLTAVRSESHRLLTILKSRDRRTDMRTRRFDIVEGGIRVDKDFMPAELILRDIAGPGSFAPALADLKLTGA